jgi:hypothetical protein
VSAAQLARSPGFDEHVTVAAVTGGCEAFWSVAPTVSGSLVCAAIVEAWERTNTKNIPAASDRSSTATH